jgi:hypothetical protein
MPAGPQAWRRWRRGTPSPTQTYLREAAAERSARALTQHAVVWSHRIRRVGRRCAKQPPIPAAELRGAVIGDCRFRMFSLDLMCGDERIDRERRIVAFICSRVGRPVVLISTVVCIPLDKSREVSKSAVWVAFLCLSGLIFEQAWLQIAPRCRALGGRAAVVAQGCKERKLACLRGSGGGLHGAASPLTVSAGSSRR